MKKIIAILLFAVVLAAGIWTPPAQAALQAVGPVSAATGYPIWYADANNLALDACIDNSGFCLAIPPNPALPPSVPGNWDPAGEMFWYMAEALIEDARVDARLTIALEAAFLGAIPPDPLSVGGQLAFARIRFSINPRDPLLANQTFTVSHPFGTATLTTRNVNQNTAVTMDVGIGLTIAQQTALGLVPGALALADDPLQAGIVNADGRSIGPFLRPSLTPGGAPLPFIVVPPNLATGFAGGTYIGNPNLPTAITGGPLGNVFTISGPATFTQDQFTVQGKVSGCGPANPAPVTVNDGAILQGGAPMTINVIANDTDAGAAGGAGAIDPATVVIVTAPTNGTAVANPDGTVTYTPNVGTTTDTFTYTVQDFCGATSLPATVTIVSGIRADFRARTGRWTVKGTLPVASAGAIVTINRDSATGPVIGTATVAADGTWKFVGKTRVSPGGAPRQLFLSAPVNLTVPFILR